MIREKRIDYEEHITWGQGHRLCEESHKQQSVWQTKEELFLLRINIFPAVPKLFLLKINSL